MTYELLFICIVDTHVHNQKYLIETLTSIDNFLFVNYYL